MTTNEKIICVREEMKRRGIDALIVLTEDPHGSEYPANHWKFREFLSGFNGSAGVMVVTNDHAGLWVDSRYYIQGEKQLRGSSIELFKVGQPNVPDYVTYLTNILPSESVVGVDGFTMPLATYRKVKKELAKFGIVLNYKVDIIDEVYAPREELPTDEVIEMDPSIAGLNRLQKVEALRKVMLENNVTHYIASALDDIAWLTNLRGNDVEYCPVFYAYMIITATEEHLYIDPHKLSSVISKRLDEDGVKLSLYDHFEKNISNLPSDARVFIDTNSLNARIALSLPKEVVRVEDSSYIGKLKAIKSPDELNHIYASHVRDGIAMVKFLHWLDDNIGKARLTELDVAAKLRDFRAQNHLFVSESFESIAAYGSNSAIVHYSPSIESNAELKPEGFLLLDTGAQYADGTTDITRTIALGELTEEACKDYTLVLKGHIALATVRFPYGTRGVQLDTMARMHLWREGEDYGHGTGHGVGFCLNVHEGPQRISKTDNGVVIEPGMVTSNEPGVYREGKHGVRIENLIACVDDVDTEFGKFLRFRTITLCPIDVRPIVVSMLTEGERKWLNDYHRKVRATLIELLADSSDREWLDKVTKEI
ncbi:MAG: aminopeptidase P family protein [Bacteroidales bacterium]|nr:aminopeptidase P family protein [Bacteroidales bacterium]